MCLPPLVMAAVLGCSGKRPTPQRAAPAAVSSASGVDRGGSTIRLESVAAQSGLRFSLGFGSKSPLNILETAPGGCAFFDADGDEWPDILLVGPDKAAFYRNQRNGKFADMTATSGLRQRGFWMGCTAGDYDGDARPDLFITGYRCAALYRNLGGGRFRDVTKEAGISGLEWSVSATFADIDMDGRLDLYVSQYLRFDSTTDQLCRVGAIMSACGPEVYDPISGKLFLNRGGGRFAAARWKDTGKTWGVVASDLLDRGRPVLYLANDQVPGDMWVWEQGGWRNIGLETGTAFDGNGHVPGGMGVDAADYDNDGRIDLVVATYFAQAANLYHNDGGTLFTVTSGSTGLGPPTMPYVGLGPSFVDLDNDGWQDLLISNGHMRDNVHDFDAGQTYAQPVQVFRNDRAKFRECTGAAGAIPTIVGRGLSVADYNRDGRMDALVCNLNGEALLLANRSTAGHWLHVRLRQPGPNRHGVGARLTLSSGKMQQVREIRTCGSVMSGRDTAAHFGLGTHTGGGTLEVRWPDGHRQRVQVARVDRAMTVSRQ